MINAKTKNALTAMSLLSFGTDQQQGIWQYSSDAASNSNAMPASVKPYAVTLH